MLRRAALLGLLLWACRAQAAPRLLVVVSVDQMRADYVDRYEVNASSGFKILFDRGAIFTNARHIHVPTETGPGHAAIMTGKYPDQTGIVANDWWDRRLSTSVYCVADSVFGLGPERLETYALGDALKGKDPASRVVSVSLKDRAAILMGGKKADAAIWFDADRGEFVSSRYYGAAPEWLASLNARLKAKGALLARYRGHWLDLRVSPDADRAVLELAEEAIGRFHLGEGERTDILAVSFSATDYIGHKWGPDSAQMKAQMKALDAVIGELIGYLRITVGEGRFDLALTADHGVLPMPEAGAGRKMGARRVMETDLAQKIEAALDRAQSPGAEKWLVAYDFPHLYLNRALARSQGLDWSGFLEKSAAALRALPELAQVYVPGEWDVKDLYNDAYVRSYFPGRSGDIIIRQTEGVLLAFDKTSTSHGSPYLYDAAVPLIFWGPDFRTGIFREPVRATDLAPTCARVLGVDFPPAPGSRVLAEIVAAH